MISPDDPEFRHKVWAMHFPTSAEHYGYSVMTEDVRKLWPEFYEEHIATWMEEHKREMDLRDLIALLGRSAREAIDANVWEAAGYDNKTTALPSSMGAGAGDLPADIQPDGAQEETEDREGEHA